MTQSHPIQNVSSPGIPAHEVRRNPYVTLGLPCNPAGPPQASFIKYLLRAHWVPGPVLGPKSHQRSACGVYFLLEEMDKTSKHRGMNMSDGVIANKINPAGGRSGTDVGAILTNGQGRPLGDRPWNGDPGGETAEITESTQQKQPERRPGGRKFPGESEEA